MLSAYERAIYGTLGGNVEQVLPACTTWEDHLWARLKYLVHCRINHVRSNILYTPFLTTRQELEIHQVHNELDAYNLSRGAANDSLASRNEEAQYPSLEHIFEDLLKSESALVRCDCLPLFSEPG